VRVKVEGVRKKDKEKGIWFKGEGISGDLKSIKPGKNLSLNFKSM